MASTYSNLKVQLMATGENAGTWGEITNVNLGTALEEAITGSADVTFANANVTLTLTDTNQSQTARNLRLNLTGTTGAARDLIVPSIEKAYIVNNGCAHDVTVKTSGGAGVVVPAGKTTYLFNNGTNVVDAINHFSGSGSALTDLNASNVSTGTLANARTTANSANGASTIVVRDASGNFAAGTVSATKLVPTGNVTTGNGMYLPTTNTLAWSTNDTERMRINASGAIGIDGANFGTSGQVLTSGGPSSPPSWGSISVAGLFTKQNPAVVAWTKTGNGTATTSTTLYIEVNGSIKTIASGTSITMPTLSAGTDYAIWAKTDGTLEATSNHTSPPTANARKVGGFHYAAGGNATGQSGGNTTAQINEYSFWDLKFRPSCSDPRGMTLVAGGFWSDIYLTGVDAITNGSSKYNVTMADGSSPPKISAKFGGNGSTTYGSYTWFEACEHACAFGKRLPTQREFMALAYGTTEASSVGSDQVSTVLNAAYTSKWGVIQSSGVLYSWADDRGGPFAAASWNANTEGRGSEYNAPNAALFGGVWNHVASGSRCSAWSNAASYSGNNVGSRFVCDHVQLD